MFEIIFWLILAVYILGIFVHIPMLHPVAVEYADMEDYSQYNYPEAFRFAEIWGHVLAHALFWPVITYSFLKQKWHGGE